MRTVLSAVRVVSCAKCEWGAQWTVGHNSFAMQDGGACNNEITNGLPAVGVCSAWRGATRGASVGMSHPSPRSVRALNPIDTLRHSRRWGGVGEPECHCGRTRVSGVLRLKRRTQSGDLGVSVVSGMLGFCTSQMWELVGTPSAPGRFCIVRGSCRREWG